MKYAIVTVLFFASAAYAGTNNYCGKKEGSGDSAFLVDDKGKEILGLAELGGDTSLLDQANALVGKGGLKNGEAYCITVMMNAGGSPVKVLKVKPDLLAKEKKTVVAPTSTAPKPLPSADEKKSQELHESPKPGTPPTQEK